MFGRRRIRALAAENAELRSAAEARTSVTQSADYFFEALDLDKWRQNAAGQTVTIDSALGVPAIWAAVNFLSGTIAGLPLKVFQKTGDGPVAAQAQLTAILNGVANQEDLTSSFDWRKNWVQQSLTFGRGVTFIERNANGRVINLWPLDPQRLTIRRRDRKKIYEYADPAGTRVYGARDVLDLPYMLKADGLTHRSPILANRDAVGLAQAVTQYGGTFFANGGVPPFAVTGNFQSGGAMKRGADDLAAAVKQAAREKRQAFVMPEGMDIKPIGAAGKDMQMIETQRFCVEQVARIFSMPPMFLQDLTHGNFANTEQQDLNLVKHTVKQRIEQIEQEINLKIFGRGSRYYAEFSLDGLLRGDFKTRMEGYARGIQNAGITPNEVAVLENRPTHEGGDQLFINGASIPLSLAGMFMQPPAPAGSGNKGGQDNAEN